MVGCGKKDEEVKPNNPLNGTYEFVSVYLKGSTELSYDLAGSSLRSVSDVEYTSTENTGMVLFEGTTMTSSGFSYKINALVTGQTYVDDVAQGQPMEVPFTFSMPRSNSTGSFKYIGTDSIMMEKGLTEIPSTGQQLPATPGATKYAFVNGHLILTSRINMSGTVKDQGVTMLKKQTGITITRLKKL